MYTLEILRRTFVRQLTDDDCGHACVAMLLHYAGEIEKARDVLTTASPGCQSLRSLKQELASQGYAAQCVTMSIEHLLKAGRPCILHTQDSSGHMHYQVYYGERKLFGLQQVLMADPANQFYFMDVRDLDKLWKSRAALYVENLSRNLCPFRRPSLFEALRFIQLPRLIWVIMPVLTCMNALFGIALSFLLQRGLVYNNIFLSRHIIIALVLLLLILSLFKSGFAYLRQFILLKINRLIRQRFFSTLARKIDLRKCDGTSGTSDWVRRTFHDISLMQNALSLFISTIVSEGSLLTILSGAIFYVMPVAGWILSVYLAFLALNIWISVPRMLYKTASIRQKSASVENLLTAAFLRRDISADNAGEKEAEYISIAENHALALSKKGLFHESLGTLAIVTILGITSFRVYNAQISYPTLMFAVIVTYVAISITPRLCSSYINFAEGADAFVQFILRTTY